MDDLFDDFKFKVALWRGLFLLKNKVYPQKCELYQNRKQDFLILIQ